MSHLLIAACAQEHQAAVLHLDRHYVTLARVLRFTPVRLDLLYPSGYTRRMNSGAALRAARARAGMTQSELARRSDTSQATISAYETGAKAPSVATLERLLAAAGSRLTVEADHQPLALPSRPRQQRIARQLEDVLALAAALPTRHEPDLRFPRLQ